MPHAGADIGHSSSMDFPSFDFNPGTVVSEDEGKRLSKREATVWWIAIVLAIGLIGFVVLWLPSLLR